MKTTMLDSEKIVGVVAKRPISWFLSNSEQAVILDMITSGGTAREALILVDFPSHGSSFLSR